jgi:hypothetical protein
LAVYLLNLLTERLAPPARCLFVVFNPIDHLS